MQLIRDIFGLQAVYSKRTPAQLVYISVWLVLAIWFAGLFGTQHHLSPYVFIAATTMLLIAFLLAVLRSALVDRYLREYPDSMLVIPPNEVASGSVNLELNKIDALKPVATYGNARLFLATCNFYTQTKYGEFLAKQAYYSVLEVQLGRHLPHILFDNKKAKGRQFKNVYLEVQRISVQGSFDDMFDCYVPQTYAIDSLSFITPEVMELMMAASNCDIEIINDKLLLYAPLLSKEKLAVLAEQGQRIAKHLNDNIDTYRDDRLTGNERVNNITPFARTLLQSPRKPMIIAGALGLIILGAVVMSFSVEPAYRDNILLNQIALLIYFLFATNVWKAGKIIRSNRKAMERYRILYRTDRGRPLK